MNKYLAERPETCFLVILNNLEIYDIYKSFYSSEHINRFNLNYILKIILF